MSLLGLDVGTSGCKSTVFSTSGEILSHSYQEYNVSRVDGEHEIDANIIWSSVKKVVFESAELANQPVKAVCISSFGESALPVDINGTPLAGAMLYTDPRGQEECIDLLNKKPQEDIARITGVNPHSMYTLPKVMWRAKHQKELFAKAHKFLMIEDFIIFKLCGEFATDYSMAARTMAFDIRKKVWSDEIFDIASINKSVFSTPHPSGTPIGKILPQIANELKLSSEAVVVTGGHDQICSAVGAGVLSSGVSTDGIGTVECITPVFDRPITEKEMQQYGYACVPHAVDGLYATYAFSVTGGAVLKWFRDNFSDKYAADADKNGINIYKYLDSIVNNKPSGILVLPHFAGATTPYMDTGAQSAVLGMKLETESIDLYRAILEGVTYEILMNIEYLGRAGINIGALHATGGGAKSPVWLQIKADILNRPISAMKNSEAGTQGAAMLAAVATGVYKNLEEAAKQFVKISRTYEPNLQMHEQYQIHFDRYRKIYDAVKEIYN